MADVIRLSGNIFEIGPELRISKQLEAGIKNCLFGFVKWSS